MIAPILLFIGLSIVGGQASTTLTKIGEHEFEEISSGLISFTAPWCPHCQRLEKELETVQKDLQNEDVSIAIVDCTQHKEFCEKKKAFGYPTIYFKRKDFLKKYTARDRSAAALTGFVKRQLAPMVAILRTNAELESFVALANKMYVTAVVQDDTSDSSSSLIEVLKDTASQLEDILFAVMVDPKHSDTDQHVILHRSFDEPTLFYRDTLTANGLLSFIQAHRKPLLDKHSIAAYGLDTPLVFLHRDLTANDDDTMAAVREASKRLRGRPVGVAWLDKNEWDGKRAGLSGQTYPALTIDDITNVNRRYAFDERLPITADNVYKWIDDVLNERVSPTRYSQPLALTKDNAKAAVKVVVLDNFERLVLEQSNKRPVFVMFHSPTCGTCQQTYAPFEALAKEMAAFDVVFAKADAWENDFPEFLALSGVPDLRLFQGDGEKTREFTSQDRTVETMRAWLLKQGVVARPEPVHSEL